jgi:hypothetical protein
MILSFSLKKIPDIGAKGLVMSVFSALLSLSTISCSLCLGVSAHDRKEQERAPVTLRGEIESVEIRAIDNSSSLIEMKLRMELVNTGTRPLIFLKRGPLFAGTALAKSPEDFKTGKFLAVGYEGPSNDISPKWAMLRASLDKPSPPTDETRIVIPGESWLLETTARAVVPTEPRSKEIYFNDTMSLQVMRELPSLWLRVSCEVWPGNVELPAPGPERAKFKFGHKLQKRWEDVGLLWLDSLQSEPITLDLKAATYKVLPQ